MPTAVKVPATWLYQKGNRLDASYYGGSGQKEARKFIASDLPRKKLREVTEEDEKGIFIPGRFKRMYVDNPEYGYPYLTGSGIVQTDPLSNCRYLSRKYTRNADVLALHPKMIVVTCSGLIGNTVYINDYFKGAVGSPDLIRIVADPEKILSGYLYAFLSSKIGKALIVQNTYGSVIQHIEAHHLYDLPIPLLAPGVMTTIHTLIEEAASLRAEANRLIKECAKYVSKSLPPISEKIREFEIFCLPSAKIGFSFAGFNNSYRVNRITENIVHNGGFQLKEITEQIFSPPLFKHIYLAKDNGYPFMTGGELQQETPLKYRFLSPRGVRRIENYIVKDGWVVIYKSGSLDGMIGTPFLIGQDLNGFCLSDHVIRLIPIPGKEKELLWAFSFFKSLQGKMMVKQLATGTGIPFILPERLGEVFIPNPQDDEELDNVASKVRLASRQKTEANLKEQQAISKIEEELA